MALFFYEGVVSIRAWPLYLDREWIKNQRGWPSYILYIEAPSSLAEMFKKKYIYISENAMVDIARMSVNVGLVFRWLA